MAWVASQANPAMASPAMLAERFRCNPATRGAIVGPHGAGKSTLLEHFKPLLYAPNVSLTLRRGERRPFQTVYSALAGSSGGRVLILDGFEQLSTAAAICVCWMVRRRAMGLLVTCHRRSLFVPTVIELKPTAQLVQQLVVERLAADSHLCEADRRRWTDLELLQQWLAQERGSVREVFMRLYDCYEESRLQAR